MITQLGDEVRDVVTDLKGIVVCRTEYLNGCIQCGVQSKELHEGKRLSWNYIDENQLVVVKKGAVQTEGQKLKDASSEAPGGPRPNPPQA